MKTQTSKLRGKKNNDISCIKEPSITSNHKKRFSLFFTSLSPSLASTKQHKTLFYPLFFPISLILSLLPSPLLSLLFAPASVLRSLRIKTLANATPFCVLQSYSPVLVQLACFSLSFRAWPFSLAQPLDSYLGSLWSPAVLDSYYLFNCFFFFIFIKYHHHSLSYTISVYSFLPIHIHTHTSITMSQARDIVGSLPSRTVSASLSSSPSNTFASPGAGFAAAAAAAAAASAKPLKPFNTEDVKILLLENVNQSGRDMLAKQGYQVEFLKTSLPEDQLIEKIR